MIAATYKGLGVRQKKGGEKKKKGKRKEDRRKERGLIFDPLRVYLPF